MGFDGPMGMPPLDAAEAFRQITRIVDDIADVPVELPALRRVLVALHELVGGVGASFVLTEAGGVRVVASSDESGWLEGRRLPFSGSARSRLFGGSDRTIGFGPDQAPHLIRDELRRRGCAWMLMSRVVRGRALLGGLVVALESPRDGELRTERAVIECLAAGLGALAIMRPDRLPEPMGSVAAAVYDVTDARRQEEAQNLFLATASHELRTPLTIVRGYAETLVTRWDQLDEAARRSVAEVIVARSRQLADLVDRLLSGDRAEVARSPIAKRFDVRAALLAALAAAGEGSHRLRIDLPAALPAVVGDPASVPTIVTELLTNAYKYSPEGGEVTVTAGADPSTVWFQVADRGVGVPAEQIESVFTRFWQVERGDQRRFGGVGLGLYIIRQLLDRQGGWVSLRPRPGGGSVVEVRWQRADARGTRGAAPAP